MKKVLLSLIALIVFSNLAIAQPEQDNPGPPPTKGIKRERIEAMKIGFITDKLNLSADEAKVFWPVYNQYQYELEKLRRDHRTSLKKAMENIDELTDTETEKIVDGEIVFRQNELDLIKKYNPQFKKVLTVKKLAKLYRAEEEFKMELLNRMNDRKGDNRKNGGAESPNPNR